MRSDHSGEERPRCQSSSGKTEGSSGTTTPGSCTKRLPLLESGSSDPSRPWKRKGREKELRERHGIGEDRDDDGGRERIVEAYLTLLVFHVM